MPNPWKNAERKVAKRLGIWACGDEKAFCRMPLQGRMLEVYLGDIIVNEKAPENLRKRAAKFLNRFMVDVKRRKSNQSGTGWHFEQFLTSPKHQIFAWWRKLAGAAKEAKKEAILVITKGDGNWFILLDAKYWNIVSQTDPIVVDHILIHCEYSAELVSLVAMNLESFLSRVCVGNICPAEAAAATVA